MRKIITLFALISVFFLFPSFTSAAEVITEDRYVLEEGERVDEDLYVFAEEVEIHGEVRGDLIISGGNVEITGSVSESLYVVAGQVFIEGATVRRNAYLAGGTINISGEFGRDVYVAGGQINGTPEIAEDLSFAGGSVNLSGAIGDDIRATAGQLRINSTVGGDAVLFGGNVRVDEDNVQGDVDINSERFSFRSVDEDAEEVAAAAALASIAARVLMFIGWLLMGIILIRVAPRITEESQALIGGSLVQFLTSMLTGIVLMVLLPVVVILLMVSVIGIPIALGILILHLFTILYAILWGDLVVGRGVLNLLNRPEDSDEKALGVGLLIRLIVGFIPIIGFIYWFILALVSSGAFFRIAYNIVVDRLRA